ncbi:ABC transporter permease [Microbispora sp. ATCC PTA-5024]|uniref:ABC transporter permease n=1 Tax=Microbispora sp. ATCC PTA-5024 TaxID=316330 RepID=UPI0003DC5EB6|nr:ABC transporter permease [Microbispora sp. ATCC PTA-5024]ETK35278.1 ABC transporter permease [Microbispora sp. ATCC PTA-5024]
MSLVLDGSTAAAAQELRSRHGLLRTIRTKVGAAVLTLAFVLVFNFFLFRVLPGDPAKNLTRNRAVPPEQIAEMRRGFGLDQPLWRQFLAYLKSTATGDLGISWQYHTEVSRLIADRFWPTLLLVGLSTLLAAAIGVWLGIRSAWKRGSRFDRISDLLTNALYAVPTFWLGLVLLIAFGGLFPTGNMITHGLDPLSAEGVLDVAWHLVLPVLAMTITYLAQYSMVMRSSLLDEMGADYLTTARAKGLRDDLVRRRHAVPNALLPTMTLIFLNIGFIISGAVTVERIFSWPGLGQLSYDALKTPDFPVLQGTFLVFSASVIVANLLSDVLLTVFDPRVRDS